MCAEKPKKDDGYGRLHNHVNELEVLSSLDISSASAESAHRKTQFDDVARWSCKVTKIG